jgi:Kef-type K+ transport system membrane component KefB
MGHPEVHSLLTIGLMLVAGHLCGLAANALKLPRITGYISAGLLLSPSVTGVLAEHHVDSLLPLITDMTLGIIAFAIGAGLLVSRVRALGKFILWITLTESVGALMLSSLSLWLAALASPALRSHDPGTLLGLVLVVGAVSVPTAPAAVLAVVHEIRAAGTVTTTLLGIVALDDALGLILFSGAVAAATLLSGVSGPSEIGAAAVFQEICGAVITGAVGGLVLERVIRTARRPEVHLVALLGFIFLQVGFCTMYGISPLLANMVMGFTLTNRMQHADELLHQMETLEEPMYCLFFALAGAHFNPGVLTSSILLSIALLVGRFAGKILGTVVGGRISHAPAEVKRYLGMTLLPQAGLSLGLIFLARPVLPASVYDVLLNAMLASIILNEFISPPLLKWAIGSAGESGLS